MSLYNKLPETIKEVDAILAGGGTTAWVVAARLADADPELSVLLIEGGPNNKDPSIEYPAFFTASLAPDSKNTLFYVTKKSAAAGDRELVLPAGGVLVGGSSTNFMMYRRAQRSDFDAGKCLDGRLTKYSRICESSRLMMAQMTVVFMGF